MKTFKAVVMVRKPHEVVYRNMRDHLPAISHKLADIESVNECEREVEPDGTVVVLNEWRLRYQVPDIIRKAIGGSELGWTDRGEWRNFACNWTIVPFFLKDQITCNGQTTFETAMGGQGARITLEGQFDIRQGAFTGAASLFEKPARNFVETIVTSTLPGNLRGVVEAASSFSDGSAQ